MRDLYRALGLSSKATKEELAAALGQQADLTAYGVVLLNEQKRAVYDRTHAALTTIGALRQRLGLDHEPTWFVENYGDYSPAAREARPVGHSAPAPAVEAQTSPPPKARRAGRGSLFVLVLAAAALAIILYLALF